MIITDVDNLLMYLLSNGSYFRKIYIDLLLTLSFFKPLLLYNGNGVVPTPFIEKMVLYCIFLAPLLKISLLLVCGFISRLFCSIGFCVCFDYSKFIICFEQDNVM